MCLYIIIRFIWDCTNCFFTPPPSIDAYEQLKENLMTRDDAVIGEAAGLAMGLVMIGTRNEMAIEDMVNVSECVCVGVWVCGCVWVWVYIVL